MMQDNARQYIRCTNSNECCKKNLLLREGNITSCLATLKQDYFLRQNKVALHFYPSLFKPAPRYSLFMRAILDTEIPLGHSASQA